MVGQEQKKSQNRTQTEQILTINLTDTLEDGKTETGQSQKKNVLKKTSKNLTLSNCYPNYTETYSDGSNKQNFKKYKL